MQGCLYQPKRHTVRQHSVACAIGQCDRTRHPCNGQRQNNTSDIGHRRNQALCERPGIVNLIEAGRTLAFDGAVVVGNVRGATPAPDRQLTGKHLGNLNCKAATLRPGCPQGAAAALSDVFRNRGTKGQARALRAQLACCNSAQSSRQARRTTTSVFERLEMQSGPNCRDRCIQT